MKRFDNQRGLFTAIRGGVFDAIRAGDEELVSVEGLGGWCVRRVSEACFRVYCPSEVRRGWPDPRHPGLNMITSCWRGAS